VLEKCICKYGHPTLSTVPVKAVLRIRDVYPGSLGSEFFHPVPVSSVKKAPDPGSATKNLNIVNPKNCFQPLRNMICDVYPGSGIHCFFPFRIPVPGAKTAEEPGSATLAHKYPLYRI
jgi:hypothetical protein